MNAVTSAIFTNSTQMHRRDAPNSHIVCEVTRIVRVKITFLRQYTVDGLLHIEPLHLTVCLNI